MIVTTTEGQRFEGENAREIVAQMRDSGWQTYDRKREYMEDVADRVEQMTGQEVRTTAEGFIEDLASAGLVTIEQPA